jgi:hypothetical protein
VPRNSMIAVISHDAGGAEILSSYVRQEGLDCLYVLEGPARKVFERKLGSINPSLSPEEAIRRSASVLCGTGWQSDLEFNAIKLARLLDKRSIAVLDHWVNYRERFIRSGETCLPDEIWVTDDYAFREAKKCFPDLKIQIKPNLYLEELVRQISPAVSGEPQVLYVLEPIRADWVEHLAGEFQALDYFAANIGKLGIKPSAMIRLRPHPSDAAGKYDAWLTSHSELNVVLDDSPSLAAAISKVEWVAGCETYAMVVALAAGRKVVSTLPPWAHLCRLPHSAIIYLRDVK